MDNVSFIMSIWLDTQNVFLWYLPNCFVYICMWCISFSSSLFLHFVRCCHFFYYYKTLIHAAVTGWGYECVRVKRCRCCWVKGWWWWGLGGGWGDGQRNSPPIVTLTGCRAPPPKSPTHIFITGNIWSSVNLIREDTYLSVSCEPPNPSPHF